jgi:hypothetical protein
MEESASVLEIKSLDSDSRAPKKGTRVTAMPAELLADCSLDREEQDPAGALPAAQSA